MIPWSELSIARYSNKTSSFKVGDFIYAVVIKIDENAHKICLNTKTLFGTWQENAANFNEGCTVDGTVVRKIDDGWQVALAPNFAGIIRECDGVNLFRGQSVRVTVQHISYDSAEICLSLEKGGGKKIAKHIDFAKHYVPLNTNFRHWDYYAPSDASYSDIEAA
jgi:ribosomal protein S1